MAVAAQRHRTNVIPFDQAFKAQGMGRQRVGRPTPPRSLPERAFEPSPTAATWIRETFILPGAPLHNPDHAHLEHAKLGVVWTGVLNNRHQRTILATCETTKQNTSGAWKKARAEQQLEDWFGELPDFLITLYAPALTAFDDRSFCAVIEHECYHAAQAKDEFGAPKFSRETGKPLFALRGHDIEEFHGVAARYGLPADLKALLDLAQQQPQLPDRVIEGACGTCLAKAA
jgi:hypothetical protein